ncbi:sodium- and chloride-dependent glycine transporter 2-like [Haliotis rubra]|uniref:sodium- and chloride-dependent glycine transporter 2-like n=1 Tax=Haliotis rubra TaxID=36100 RepID=UPI001EE62595|nr:sodium- and chloride-dependent glycine transporter 2-like [Haliotis rubra]
MSQDGRYPETDQEEQKREVWTNKREYILSQVVYVTAVLPYILLTVLLIRSCMMPGSVDGLLYFLRPDFSKLLTVQVWLEALLQSFYAMNTTYGGLITMGSFNSFNNNCIRDVVLVTIIGQLSCIFCGFTVFSTLGFMANEAQVPIAEVVSSGSGLGFIIYPEAISKLPLSQLWAVLFFLTLLTVGIDSMGGVYLFQLLDWYSSSFNALLIGCLECVVIYWIYGSERFGKDIKTMLGRRPPTLLRLLLSYVTPGILFAALVVSLFGYDPPSYGEYIYPEIAKIMGILLAVGFSVPIPVMFVYECLRKKGSICQINSCQNDEPGMDTTVINGMARQCRRF